MTSAELKISLTPGIPTYAVARIFLEIIQGVPYLVYNQMRDHIWEQVGTPQDTIDWTNPDEWIPNRLQGEAYNLALKIWKFSKGIVNPRYTRGSWYLCNKHDLIRQNSNNLLEITEKGRAFLGEPFGEETIRIDKAEGLLNILQSVGEHSPGKRSDILPAFIEFCNNFTNYRSDSVYKSALYDRMVNLVDRGLVKKQSGVFYEITERGIQYLETVSTQIPGRSLNTQQTDMNKLAQLITQGARKKLHGFLSQMDPYKFEHLIGMLLEEMGYENILVTTPGNDKGVDVVADIELGISSVREVVQVKRYTGSINRKIVDLLRGSLHRFEAFRGTIISTGSFASGAKKAALEQNAAPITLIDGEKLIDLLLLHEIGITRKSVEFYEFDDQKLHQFEEDQADFVGEKK